MDSVKHLIDIALKEDIGPGDITTDNLVPSQIEGHGVILAKEPLVIAGLDISRQVFECLDPQIRFRPRYTDGDAIKAGAVVLEVEGKLRALLTGERTALNFTAPFGHCDLRAFICGKAWEQECPPCRYPQDNTGMAGVGKICGARGRRL